MNDEQIPEIKVTEISDVPKEEWNALFSADEASLRQEELEAIQKLALKVLADLEQRAFSARHPELGKMTKCQVCLRRHRSSEVCVQKFKYLHTEEEVDTGKTTDVFAIRNRPGRPKGRRLPRPNHNHLEVVKIVRDLYGKDTEYDRGNAEDVARLQEFRVEAIREWKRRRRVKAKQKRKQQDVSRRINRGLLQGGFRP
jgi:hypothetical protein